MLKYSLFEWPDWCLKLFLFLQFYLVPLIVHKLLNAPLSNRLCKLFLVVMVQSPGCVWVLSVSLCDGGGVCAGGLSVGVSETNGRSGSRDPLLHCSLPWRKEKPGSVLLDTGRSRALGSRPSHAQRPHLQHEPERKAGPISLKPYLQRKNASNFLTASRHTFTAFNTHLIRGFKQKD